jgi:hypothetical protein
MYLGFSPKHSSTGGRMLNLVTGRISSQYHLVYDKLYTTVTSPALGEELLPNQVFHPKIWNDLLQFGYKRHEYLDDIGVASHILLDDDWLTPAEREARQTLRDSRRINLRLRELAMNDRNVAERVLSRDILLLPPSSPPVQAPSPRQSMSPRGTDTTVNIQPLNLTPILEQHPSPQPVPVQPNTSPGLLRRASRVRTQNPRYLDKEQWVNYQSGSSGYGTQKFPSSLFNRMFIQNLNWKSDWTAIDSADLLALLGSVDCDVDYKEDTVEAWHPLALQVRANAKDNPTWEAAMNGQDQSGYWKAMEAELKTLEIHKKSWDVVDKAPWMNVLSSTWAFKCKRFPDGSICKLKARFCVRGDRQKEGIDYFDTFAPVASWQTVCLMMVLSVILDLTAKQVDYTAAFVHAPIDNPPNYALLSTEDKARSGVYVAIPRGFMQPNKVLRLKKSLYRLKQAPQSLF